MAIEFRCTKCNKLLRTADDTAGKHAKCPECGEILLIPSSFQPTPQPTDAGGGATPPSGPENGNPFESGSLPQYPPDSGNPYQSPSQSGLPPKTAIEIHPTIIDLGNVMSRAWSIFKEQWAMCLGTVVVAGICSLLVGLLINRIFDPMFGVAIDFRRFRVEEFYRFMFYTHVKGFIALFFNVWLNTGVFLAMLKIARGQQASIGDVFSGGKYYVTMLVIAFLFQILITIGSFLLFIPGFILVMIWQQYSCVIIDLDAGISDSWTLYSRITKGNIGSQILLGLLSFAIMLLGLFACCVGLLVAGPFVTLLNVVIYLSMAGQPTIDQLRGGMAR